MNFVLNIFFFLPRCMEFGLLKYPFVTCFLVFSSLALTWCLIVFATSGKMFLVGLCLLHLVLPVFFVFWHKLQKIYWH